MPGPLDLACLQLAAGGVASADHHQREGVEADASPVLDEKEDEAVQSVQNHAGDERPAVSLDRLESEEREEPDHGQAHEAGGHVRRRRSVLLRQLLDDLRDAETENEAPLL